MYNKRNKLIYVLIILSVVISGMYFENFKADSAFVCSPAEKTNSYISSVNAAITKVHACTTEMLGIHGSMELEQLTIRFANQRRDIKMSLDFLCQIIFCINERKSYAVFEEIQFVSGNQDELIINYIHKSDGKKRI